MIGVLGGPITYENILAAYLTDIDLNTVASQKRARRDRSTFAENRLYSQIILEDDVNSTHITTIRNKANQLIQTHMGVSQYTAKTIISATWFQVTPFPSDFGNKYFNTSQVPHVVNIVFVTNISHVLQKVSPRIFTRNLGCHCVEVNITTHLHSTSLNARPVKV